MLCRDRVQLEEEVVEVTLWWHRGQEEKEGEEKGEEEEEEETGRYQLSLPYFASPAYIAWTVDTSTSSGY